MANQYMGDNFDELYMRVLHDINEHPEYETAPRGMKIRETIAPTLVLLDPRARLLANPAREANYGFAVGEFIWYLLGKNDLETMIYYNKRMKDFSDDGRTLNSAYGFRTRFVDNVYDINKAVTQWDACRKTLIDDPDSRRALLIINRAEDNTKAAMLGSKDVPCTLSLQFFIRRPLMEGQPRRLVLHAHMRSNDAVWGLTYDLFSFTLLQELMLNELRIYGMEDLELGEYIHTAGSLHIYERHFEMASAVVQNYLSPGFKAAAPMEPIANPELAVLAKQEEALRTGRVAKLDEACFGGGVRWMAERLNEHRRKRDDERGR